MPATQASERGNDALIVRITNAQCNIKGLAKLGNIGAETFFLLCFPGWLKLAVSKQNVLLPSWLNEETLVR